MANTGAGSGGSGGKSPHGMAAYEQIAVIGKGSFGTVSKVRRRSDNRVSATGPAVTRGLTRVTRAMCPYTPAAARPPLRPPPLAPRNAVLLVLSQWHALPALVLRSWK